MAEDLKKDMRDRPNEYRHLKSHDERERCVTQHVKRYVKGQLKDKFTPVFAIDNYEPEMLAFRQLEKHLIENLPQLKRRALVLSLETRSLEVLEEKVKQLEARIERVNVVPVSYVYSTIDAGIIKDESNFYRCQLGIDDDSLERYANSASMKVETLKKIVENNESGMTTFGTAFSKVHISEGSPNFLRCIPLIGAPWAIINTRAALMHLLR